MKFKKIFTAVVMILTVNAMALTESEIKKIDRVINEGTLLQKKIKSDDQVSIEIYKAMVTNTESYALIKMKNLSNKKVRIKDFLSYGKPVKPIIAPEEYTYVLVVENKDISNKRERKNTKIMQEDLKKALSTNISQISDYLSKGVMIYNVLGKNGHTKIHQINMADFKDYLKDGSHIDLYRYTKNNVQNSLYQGYFYSGYETRKNGQILPRSFYFIADQVTNEISIIYMANERTDYEGLKESIKAYKGDNK